MAGEPVQRPTGHVFRVDRKRGAVRHAKYRLPDGRQVQRKIGPAWSGRGRPSAGYVTHKRLAEDWLRSVLEEARRGRRTGTRRPQLGTWRRCGPGPAASQTPAGALAPLRDRHVSARNLSEEIISTVNARRAPMMHASADLAL